jgi:hypothetical protein
VSIIDVTAFPIYFSSRVLLCLKEQPLQNGDWTSSEDSIFSTVFSIDTEYIAKRTNAELNLVNTFMNQKSSLDEYKFCSSCKLQVT